MLTHLSAYVLKDTAFSLVCTEPSWPQQRLLPSLSTQGHCSQLVLSPHWVIPISRNTCCYFSQLKREISISPPSLAPPPFSLSLFKNLLMYLFSAMLGLRCYARAFFSCSEWGLLSNCAPALECSVVVAHGLSCLSACKIFPDHVFCIGRWSPSLLFTAKPC